MLAPCGAGVGEQDVDVCACLMDFGNEPLDLGDFGAVGWDGDCAGIRAQVREGVEGGGGFGAGGGFARGDVDFGAACLEETLSLLVWSDSGVELGEGGVPACGVETEAAGAAGDDGDFAFEGEDGGEVLELDLVGGGHFWT